MFEREEKKFLSGIPNELQHVLEKTGSFIAGGSITSTFCNREINDYDIYVPSKSAAVAVVAWAMGEEEYTHADTGSFQGIITSFTERSITFKAQETDQLFQIILFAYFEDAQNIFEKFDFTCCMGAYDFKNKKFILHDDFLKHNSQRTIVFNPNTSFPLVSLLRVEKYKDKGYYIPKSEFIRVVLRCSQLEINSWEELASHIGGLYGRVDDSIFNKEEEFTIENAISQLSQIDNTPQARGNFDEVNFLNIVKIIHGDDPIKDDSECPDYEDGYLYKRVVKNGDKYFSQFSKGFEYKVGGTIEPQKNGIYIDLDPENPDLPYLNWVCKMRLIDGQVSGKKVIGTLEVVDIFYKPADEDFLLALYRVENPE
jgi:hypothetical protein